MTAPLLRRSAFGLAEPLEGVVAPELGEWEVRFSRFGREYRRLTRQMWWLFCVGTALMLAAYFVPVLRFWTGLPGFLLTMGTLIPFARLPRLSCPSCAESLERVARFCPMCGADAVLVEPEANTVCNGCGEVLQSRPATKGRQFTIHFCTGCGVLVDRLGV